MTRVCAFTLATALAWVGHDCTGGCPDPARLLRADVWFIRRPRTRHVRATTLVVVDFFEGLSHTTPLPDHAMLRQVNHCTRPDNVVVRQRVGGSGRLALVAMPDSQS